MGAAKEQNRRKEDMDIVEDVRSGKATGCWQKSREHICFLLDRAPAAGIKER